MKIKTFIIGMCAFLIVGCKGVTKEQFDTWATKHDQALTSAVQHMDKADAGLATIVNPPAQVPAARTEIAAAKKDVGVAQAVSAQVIAAAQATVEKNDKLETAVIGPRGKAILAMATVTILLVGLAVVLFKYGGLGGSLAAIPVLGLVLAKIGMIEKKPKL